MFEKSKQFFADFNNIFAEGSETREKAILEYIHNTSFTKFIISQINKIIETQNYRPQNEYFRIDCMGYTSRREELPEEGININPHLWDLEIAVEHENDDQDWLDEVVKLAHVCCPLRVVIGYLPMCLRNQDKEYLDYTAKVLSMLNCRENVLSGEFMVILGNSKTKGNPDNYFNYKAYVLNKKTFSFEELK